MKFFTIITPLLAIMLTRISSNILFSVLTLILFDSLLFTYFYVINIKMTKACTTLFLLLNIEYNTSILYLSSVLSDNIGLAVAPIVTALALSILLIYNLLRKIESTRTFTYNNIAMCIRDSIGLKTVIDKIIDSMKLSMKAKIAGVNGTSLEHRLLLSSVIGLVMIFYPLFLIVSALWRILSFLILSLPLVVVGLYAYLSSKANDRARLAEQELAFLALWAWLLEKSGTGTLSDALSYAYTSKLFKSIHKDANSSIDELAEIHPSRNLRRFYRYYSAIRSMGGSTVEFLENIVSTTIEELRHMIESYAEKGHAVGTLILGSMATLLVFAFFSQFLGFTSAIPFSSIAIIVLTITGWLVLNTTQPQLKEEIRDKQVLIVSFLIAIIVCVILLWMDVAPLYLLAIPLLLFMGFYGAWFTNLIRKLSREEEDIISLLRLIIEHARTMPEKPLQVVVKEMYSSHSNEIVRLESLLSGVGKPKSWLSKYVIYTLQEFIAKKGAIDVLALERLYDLAHNYYHARRVAANRLRILSGLSIGFPPVIVIASRLLEQIVTSEAYMLVLPLTALDTKALLVISILTSTAMGLLTSKATSLTIRNTLYPLASLLATLTAALIPLNLG